MQLEVANSTTTVYYSVTNAVPTTPYLQISDQYLPLTTASSQGARLKVESGTETFRACSYESGYYITTSDAPGQMSSTTALTQVSTTSTTYLTRASTSDTIYGTAISTSGTEYGTRVSTSDTAYGTRASTSDTAYLTRVSTSDTVYGTQVSTSDTTYLTRVSTSGTTYLTQASTSDTVYGTRASTSDTQWETRASTSGTTYLTNASTSGTTYLTRVSTSDTQYGTKASTTSTLYLTAVSTTGQEYETTAEITSYTTTLWDSFINAKMSLSGVPYYEIEYNDESVHISATSYWSFTREFNASYYQPVISAAYSDYNKGHLTLSIPESVSQQSTTNLLVAMSTGYYTSIMRQWYTAQAWHTNRPQMTLIGTTYFTNAMQNATSPDPMSMTPYARFSNLTNPLVIMTNSGMRTSPLNRVSSTNTTMTSSWGITTNAPQQGRQTLTIENWCEFCGTSTTSTTKLSYYSGGGDWKSVVDSNGFTATLHTCSLISLTGVVSSREVESTGEIIITTGTKYLTGAVTTGTSYLTGAVTTATTYLTCASTSDTQYATRVSTSDTVYGTRASTSATSYLTRASTSATSYLTRASTSDTAYGTRVSTSDTSYGTRVSTSGTTYLTRASTSATEYLTRASTSGTTYLTQVSTSDTTYLTRISTSATTYLTRASTSDTQYGTSVSTSGYSGSLSSSTWA